MAKVTNLSKTIVVVDLALAALLGTVIASTALPDTNQFIYILLGGFVGILPDVVEGPYFFMGWKHEVLKKWVKFQKAIQVDVDVIPGMATQVVTVLAAFLWLAN